MATPKLTHEQKLSVLESRHFAEMRKQAARQALAEKRRQAREEKARQKAFAAKLRGKQVASRKSRKKNVKIAKRIWRRLI